MDPAKTLWRFPKRQRLWGESRGAAGAQRWRQVCLTLFRHGIQTVFPSLILCFSLQRSSWKQFFSVWIHTWGTVNWVMWNKHILLSAYWVIAYLLLISSGRSADFGWRKVTRLLDLKWQSKEPTQLPQNRNTAHTSAFTFQSLWFPVNEKQKWICWHSGLTLHMQVCFVLRSW